MQFRVAEALVGVSRAITLMHNEPAEPWTLEELGHRIGLSRSALRERSSARRGYRRRLEEGRNRR
jgi:transcriptional regulator GlxA family with amidase domain